MTYFRKLCKEMNFRKELREAENQLKRFGPDHMDNEVEEEEEDVGEEEDEDSENDETDEDDDDDKDDESSNSDDYIPSKRIKLHRQ